MTQFADYFPGIEAHLTRDPRIFQTKWERNTRHPDLNAQKEKQYFACILGEVEGNNCFGVTVTRGIGVRADKQCEEAFVKVQEVVNYYQEHNACPKQQSMQEDAHPSS